MPKRNQPPDLLNLSADKSLELIVKWCYDITRNYPETNLQQRYRQADILRMFLISMLPLSLFRILCSKRKKIMYFGDPQVWLHVLIHPKITVLYSCQLDFNILEHYWVRTLPLLTQLVVLRLHCTCTDEILKIIGTNCLMLEELNISSKTYHHKNPDNTSVTRHKVSESGLFYITNLQKLRILAMNSLKREHISINGVVMLLTQIPQLEWFVTPGVHSDCINIANSLSMLNTDIGPLRLKMLECAQIPSNGMQKILTSCPYLQELYMFYWPKPTQVKDDVLEQITESKARLNKLGLMYFTYSSSLQRLLKAQGLYLTQLFLCDAYESINMNALLQIGLSCPHLVYLGLHTNSYNLIPNQYRGIFNKLETLILGVRNYDIENVMLFLLGCTQNMKRLVVSYDVAINASDSFKDALESGYLKNIEHIWLNHNIILSIDIVKNIIKECDNLIVFKVTSDNDWGDINKYISDNNLNLRLNRWEQITQTFEKYCLLQMLRYTIIPY